MVYRLDAVDAYQQRLVKQIEVAAATVEDAHNRPYLRLVSVSHKTEQRFERQTLLMTKEREADQRLSELQIQTLTENVARQTAQIAALQKQVDDAKQQVQDIAVKAIEGASGARALAHANQIAMEQAKTRAGQV